MQKVHGAPIQPGIAPQRHFTAGLVTGPLLVSLSLLLVVCALVYFRSIAAA